MQQTIQRRTILVGAMVVAAAPVFGRHLVGDRKLTPDKGFSHGIATGEPQPDSMVFWTRYVGKDSRLRLEISRNPSMEKAEKAGETEPDPARDYTARLRVEQLEPGQTYYYRWVTRSGGTSQTGRTRTLPDRSGREVRLAVFEGTSLPGGWFNAYAHAIRAGDFDAFLHLGNYIHQEPLSMVPARAIVPAQPPRRREDFWARYRLYRSDPLLLQLHATFPIIALFDNSDLRAVHDLPALAAAHKAFSDWLPTGDQNYARYPLGSFGTLYRTDACSYADPPIPEVGTMAPEALKERWLAGYRQLLGRKQESWLFNGMAEAAATGASWQVVAGQRQVEEIGAPDNLASLVSPAGESFARQAALVAKAGLPLFPNSWAGYPAARARLLSLSRLNRANLVSLSPGHGNAWGADLLNNGIAAGVEFATPSATAPGLEAILRAPEEAAQSFRQENRNLRFLDLSRRGYLRLAFGPTGVGAQWRFTAPVTGLSAELQGVWNATVAAGSRKIQPMA